MLGHHILLRVLKAITAHVFNNASAGTAFRSADVRLAARAKHRADPLCHSPVTVTVVPSWLGCRRSSRPADSAVCQCDQSRREGSVEPPSREFHDTDSAGLSGLGWTAHLTSLT